GDDGRRCGGPKIADFIENPPDFSWIHTWSHVGTLLALIMAIPDDPDRYLYQGVVMRNSLKKLTLGVIALGAFSLTACMNSGSAVGPESSDNATVFVTTKMKNINTLSKPGLAKLTPIELTTLRITAVSDIAGTRTLGEDSVVVEFDAGDVVGDGPGTFLDDATADQQFNVKLSLRPLRSWTITVETIDDEDSVIQSGTDTL